MQPIQTRFQSLTENHIESVQTAEQLRHDLIHKAATSTEDTESKFKLKRIFYRKPADSDRYEF